LPDLVSSINGYPFCYTLTKNEDDGSQQILGFLAEFPHFIPIWRICGVHLDACVWETIVGLKNILEKTRLEVVRNGVAPSTTRDKSKILKTLERKGINVK
tara:strand:+ start:2481 stop:2780 length:300 start_codon:yes stop_codon:yes gene_type:complete